MEKQKTALVVSAMVLALSGMGQVVYAQAVQERGDGPGLPPRAGQMHRKGAADRLDRMTRHLDLTDAQQSQIKPLLDDEEKQLKALQDQARAIRQATREKIKPILTPAQQKKVDTMRDDATQRWQEQHHRPQ